MNNALNALHAASQWLIPVRRVDSMQVWQVKEVPTTEQVERVLP